MHEVFDSATYWCLLQSVAARYNISHVFISSDAATYIHDVAHVYAPIAVRSLRIYYTPANRVDTGSQEKVMKRDVYNKPAVDDLMRVLLSEYFIARHATAWVGTLASNVGRLHNELRAGHGRFGSPFHALDKEQ